MSVTHSSPYTTSRYPTAVDIFDDLFYGDERPLIKRLVKAVQALQTQNVGVGSLGVVRPASPTAFTQTYSTTATTVPNATYAAPSAQTGAVVLTATAIAAKVASDTLSDSGTADAAAVADSLNQAQKSLGTKLNSLRTDAANDRTAIAALAADVLELKKLINSLIDIDQAAALAS